LSKQAADDKVQELRSKGYNSSEVIRSKKGYYRVSLGKYSSLDVAQEKQREAIAEGYIPVDAWIVPREKARD